MRMLRWVVIGLIASTVYKVVARSFDGPTGAAQGRGVAATFSSREAADLAVEHLVQEHGVDRTAIFVEAVGDSNSAGSEISGGDAGGAQSGDRADAPLNGNLRLTVAVDGHDSNTLIGVLEEAGAQEIRSI